MSGAPFPASVTVTVPARLHLGFLDLNGGLGRRFGSIGVAISGPRTRITIRAASRMQVTGPERERVEGHIETMRRVLNLRGAYDVEMNERLGKVSLIGAGMRSHPGVAATMFRTLADRGINLEMISTSPIKISCMIDRDRIPEAVRALHEVFALEREPEVEPTI